MFFTSKDINLNKFKLAYPTKGWLKNLKTCSSTEKNIITIVLNNLWQFLPKINEKEKRLMIQKYNAHLKTWEENRKPPRCGLERLF